MKRTSKLKLNRQTLARIDSRRLAAVQGGTDRPGDPDPAGNTNGATRDLLYCLSDGFGCQQAPDKDDTT